MWRYSSVARATGSYPVGRKFKSHCRYHIWPVGQAVKTPPFHGGITSSILVRVTKSSKSDDLLLFLFVQTGTMWASYPTKIVVYITAYGLMPTSARIFIKSQVRSVFAC